MAAMVRGLKLRTIMLYLLDQCRFCAALQRSSEQLCNVWLEFQNKACLGLGEDHGLG